MNGKKLFYTLTFFFSACLIYWGFVFRKSVAQMPADKMGVLPSFTLSSSLTKKSVSREDLYGKVWIASFIFSRCSGPCPTISSNMFRLQEVLPPEVMLVTFSVDPDWDKPAILARYAGRFSADPNRWLFLTGEKKQLYNLLYEGFKLPLFENPEEPESSRITHSTKLVLVDQTGAVRKYYDGTELFSLDKMKQDVLRLLKEKREGGTG